MKWLAIFSLSAVPLLAADPVIIVPPPPVQPIVMQNPASPAQANQAVMNQVINQLNRQQLQLSIAQAQTSPVYAQPFVYPRQVIIKPGK